jgi:protein-glutamine gamma-glutamyltransferase
MRTTRSLRLPRETRDTLLLLAVIAWTLLPHVWHVPWWCNVLTASVLVWRASIALTARSLPPAAVRFFFLALAVGLTWSTYGTVIGKDPGVTLLVMLVVIKTLELRARRDAMVIFFLGFFLIVTNFFYSQSLLLALAMVVAVWGLLTALVLANLHAGHPSLRAAGAVAARMAALSLPVMVVLFFIFPRIGPLWGGDQGGRATTGLSGSMRMGGIAELTQSEQIAFRVRFEGTAPPQAQLYFRGPVLTRFDGRDWTAMPAQAQAPQHAVTFGGTAYAYETVIEPSNMPLLPLLEWTSSVDMSDAALREHGPRRQDDGQWRTERRVDERLTVRAKGHARTRMGPLTPDGSLAEALVIPEATNPRTVQWARRLIDRERDLHEGGTPAVVKRLLAHINQGYTYTHAPGSYGDARGHFAIDEFWLDRREGFCEHFASAMVFVLRAIGIPSRVVTGYQGADEQLQDGWHVVRQLNAHAWVEVWMQGAGWVRVDPTASVAPERVERGLGLRPPQGLVSNVFNTIDPSLWPSLRNHWETMQLRWDRWVVHYSRGQQFDLLKKIGVTSPQWEHLIYAVVGLLVTASAVGTGWAWWDRRRRDPWERLQSDVRARLRALGLQADPHEGPRALARRVTDELGDTGRTMAALLQGLEVARYAGEGLAKPNARWWRDFQRAANAVSRHVHVSDFSSSMLPTRSHQGDASGSNTPASKRR